MNAKRLGNILDQDAGLTTHMHRLQLACEPVPMNLLRSWCTHRTPSSLGESVNKTDSRSQTRASDRLGERQLAFETPSGRAKAQCKMSPPTLPSLTAMVRNNSSLPPLKAGSRR